MKLWMLAGDSERLQSLPMLASSTFIAEASLYSATLGVAITHACYAKGENHEHADQIIKLKRYAASKRST
jgi:hypothetical protein